MTDLETFNAAIVAIAAAEGALARAAKAFPDVGQCVVRAVIDVERGNLKSSRRHLLSTRSVVELRHVD
jgi:hypothetical protein